MAAVTLKPFRAGTLTFGLPVETKILTVPGLGQGCPAGGSCETTSPFGTDGLASWITFTLKPSAWSFCAARSALRSPTSVTATGLFWLSWFWILW